jgi:hypothetical protein
MDQPVAKTKVPEQPTDARAKTQERVKIAVRSMAQVGHELAGFRFPGRGKVSIADVTPEQADEIRVYAGTAAGRLTVLDSVPVDSTPAEATKLVRVTAISLAPPGHFRGGHYWQAGEPTFAEVTEPELAAIKRDGRLQILEGTISNAIAESDVIKAIAADRSEDRVLREAEKILTDRKAGETRAGAIRKKFEVGR